MRFVQKGTTKYFNMYELNIECAKLVDSPSYFHSEMSTVSSNKIKKLIKTYLSESSRICKIFLCLPITTHFAESDQVFFNFLTNLEVPVQIVFTKADILTKQEAYEKMLSFSHKLKPYKHFLSPIVHLTDKSGFGIDQIRSAIKQAVLEFPTRIISIKEGKIYYNTKEVYSSFEEETFPALIQGSTNNHLKLLKN